MWWCCVHGLFGGQVLVVPDLCGGAWEYWAVVYVGCMVLVSWYGGVANDLGDVMVDLGDVMGWVPLVLALEFLG